jgi:coenzyme F420-0:L-glutamate ligase/coenzyme F420-1:gamma-L-glutamate ligase
MQVWAIEGIPEITEGDDLATLIGDRFESEGPQDGDILMVTSKIVSKAEGRSVEAKDREQAITDETVRLVASREHPGGVTRIVENRLGLVMAAAGVDSSNTPDGTVLLLPVDPDASARVIAENLRKRFGVRIGVIVSDTLGRPWRLGQTDAAIGAAGIRVFEDLRGSTDAGGRPLEATITAVADELAGAADLVKGKAAGLPVAVVRGMGQLVGDIDLPGARSLVRSADQDMFRLGSDEAYATGMRDGSLSP